MWPAWGQPIKTEARGFWGPFRTSLAFGAAIAIWRPERPILPRCLASRRPPPGRALCRRGDIDTDWNLGAHGREDKQRRPEAMSETVDAVWTRRAWVVLPGAAAALSCVVRPDNESLMLIQ